MAQTEIRQAEDVAAALTESVVEFLLERGFKVEAPAKLRGESGAEHRASLSATAENRPRLILDVYASLEGITEMEVINTYTKVLDTGPSQAYIVCLPGATDLARHLAQLYRIAVVEVTSLEEAPSKLSASSMAPVARPNAPAHKPIDLNRPGVLKCYRCGYVWKTKSGSKHATCPSCYLRVNQARAATAKLLIQNN